MVGGDIHRILDIGCGTGVLTYALEQARPARGYCVGLDASRAMLAEAQRQQSDILWIEGDMRAPPLFGRFDLVTCGLNTFQHLLSDEDALDMLRAVAALLAPSGIFAFDLFNPDPTYLQPSRLGAPVRTVDAPGGRFDLTEDTRYDAESRILSILWRLPDAQGAACEACFHMRQYWPTDVAALLREAGLEILAAEGGFASESLDAQAVRQVYRCRLQ